MNPTETTAANGAAAAGSVGSGVISGGWDYIWSAYGITWAALAIYALSLFLRYRGSRE